MFIVHTSTCLMKTNSNSNAKALITITMQSLIHGNMIYREDKISKQFAKEGKGEGKYKTIKAPIKTRVSMENLQLQ